MFKLRGTFELSNGLHFFLSATSPIWHIYLDYIPFEINARICFTAAAITKITSHPDQAAGQYFTSSERGELS